MKKLSAFFVTAFLGIGLSFGQSASTSTTQNTAKATPAVNAAEMSQSAPKCTSETKSCCMSGSKAAAVTATSDAAASSNGEQCKSVSVGMSAAKPETQAKEENPEK